jgi:hypothetical protein
MRVRCSELRAISGRSTAHRGQRGQAAGAFAEAVERVILMLNLLIRRSRLGRFWSEADMQMVVSGKQTGGNDPLAT